MLVSLGLDHQHAELGLRERFHVRDEDVERLHAALAECGVLESVLMRTCNRIELYCWWPEQDASLAGRDAVGEICRAWTHGDREAARVLRSSAQIRAGEEAARHLFRVSSGLESQVLGDMHIIGQVRRSLRDAVEYRSVGSNLQRLFQSALRIGKEVKRSTGLMATRKSIGRAAALCAAGAIGDPEEGPFAIVGCGKSGVLAALTLAEMGVQDLVLINRTRSRAEELVSELGYGEARGLDALPAALASARAVIVATGATEPLLTRDSVLDAWEGRSASSPLLVVDISVPRNVAPEVGALPGVELIDLDGLAPDSSDAEETRRGAVERAEVLVEDAVAEFVGWLELGSARDALGPFRTVLADICRREIAYLTGSLGDVSDETAPPPVERTADRIVARVMAHPMTVLRSASQRGEPFAEVAGTLKRLFAGDGLPTPAEARVQYATVRSAGISQHTERSIGQRRLTR